MKTWKATIVLLVVGTSCVFGGEGSACRFRFRRDVSPCYFPPPPKPPVAKDTVDLRWKFEANKPFYVVITTKTDQTMKAQGINSTQKQSQTTFLCVTPEKKDEKGNWILGMKFVGIRMSIDSGGNKIDIDSTKKQPPNHPMTAFLKAFVKLKFKVILGPDGTISRVEGQEEFIREYAKSNPQMEPMLKSILAENAIKNMGAPIFPPLPQSSVKKGESWSRQSLLISTIGSGKFTTTYTYEGREGSLEKIKVEASGSLSPPNRGGMLKTSRKPMPGVIFFDPSLGRVVRASIPMKLKGTLNIDIGGMIMIGEWSQFQTTTVTVTDTNPVQRKGE
jgi:hypothetical protein